ncbi:endonuclease domain-containing protein [Micrococcus lylae]|uniref:endonuclease domain-containing protein n=1 Tax=Micrococcus lylae TaxID=1273 RepID=UPI003EC0255E
MPAEDVEVMHGIPVTSIERTWADLAALLPMGMVDELVVAGDGIVKRPWTPQGRLEPLTTVQRLRDAVKRAGRYKGVRTARAALDLIRVGSDAATETKMRLALVHAGLPEPELQLILDPSRPMSPDGDMGYRQWRLVLHYDGAPHDDEAQKLVDAWRNKGWHDAGWAQIWATVEDYRDDFRRVIHEVRCRRDEVEGQG